MSPLTEVRNEITKAFESAEVPKPLYAVAGVGDFAVEKLRDVEKRVRALKLDERLAGLGADARTLPDRVQTVGTDVQCRARELPAGVVNAATSAGDRATAVYENLSVRGKKFVDGLAVQRAVTITDAPKHDGDTAAPQNGAASAKKTAAKKTAANKTAAKKTAAKKTQAKSTAKKTQQAKSTAKKTQAKSANGSTKASTTSSAKKGKATKGAAKKA